jgi:hypothetical protein
MGTLGALAYPCMKLSDEWRDASMEVDGAPGGIGAFMKYKEKNPRMFGRPCAYSRDKASNHT